MANIEKTRQIKRDWARKHRSSQRYIRLIVRRRCPVCLIVISQEFEMFHKGCPWYEVNNGSLGQILKHA